MLRTVIGLILGFALVACSGGGDSGGNPSTTGGSGTPTGPTVTSGGPMGSGSGTGTMTGGSGGAGGSGGGMQQLTVQLAGPGQGTVTSSPAGIDCSNAGAGGPCSASFPTGTTITLTAMPSGASMFGGWTNGCAGSGPCTLALDAPRNVTALFTQGNALTVNVVGDGKGTVVSNPPGINCMSGSTQGCSYGFPNDIGSSVSLTVTPAAGSSFAGWSFGGCSGSPYTHTCPVPLSTSGSSVTVSFSAWQARQPFPSAVGAVASFKGSYLVVGSGAAAATSPDGAGSWTGQILASQEPLRGIATDGALAVAVGDHGTILTTTDAATWTPATSGSMVSLTGVAFGGGTFVAVGSGGTILTSANGTSWNAATSMTAYDLLAVTFGGGQFVAVGYGGTILTSSDGRSWTARTSMTTQFLGAVTFGSGRYVAVGSAGAVVTSPDAMTWTAQTPFTTSALRAVASASGSPAYVASGDAMTMSSPSSALVFTSDDGASWTPRDTGAFQEQFTGMANLGGAWFALGNGGSILRSTNGTGWNPSLSPGGRGPIGSHDGTSIAAVAFGGGTYVATGSYGSIFTSPDGHTWTSRAADRVGVSSTAVAYGGIFVVAQNLQGSWRILSSPDGKVWNERATGGPGSLQGVAYGGAAKGFVAVGSHNAGSAYTGVVSTSPDGITWTPRSGASITSPLTSIAFGANLFAVTGQAGSIYTSPDGVSWTPQASPITDNLGALAFGNGVFVAVGTQNIGKVTVTSADGIAWKANNLSLMLGGTLVFGKGTFMSSALHTSTDGVNWTASGGLPEGVTQINGGLFTSAVYGSTGWVGGSLFETFLFHP